MRRPRGILSVALLASVALSCGGGGGGADTLTCGWLAGDNCWKATVDDAAACLPPETERGALSADGKTCTYASGATVTFATPIVLPIPQSQTSLKLNFTVTNGGADCLHYEDLPQGLKLVVKGQTVVDSVSGYGLTISCPDGTSFSSSNVIGLLMCDADAGVSVGGLPGKAWSWTPTSISFGLIGTSGASQSVFDCGR